MNWDLWLPKSEDPSDGWERKTQEVSILCMGSQFCQGGASEESEDSGHMEVNFGPEENFLPPELWDLDPEERAEAMASPEMQDNIAKLITYARMLEQHLPVERRLLWSESGDDLPEQILSIWRMD